ncbi:integrator complex subunit 5-like isoform X2 [Pomacea canaliculata]|uniref:integrator complex subunit 5-like isoform X2 n=1 Tax=Pomacea canaliculata TaxID=400727 RepID=UPI000D726B2E|nr:integrator complex subunit 5-like isoform X2 [Pomacea canaliculata]
MASAWDSSSAGSISSAFVAPHDILKEVNVFLCGATCPGKVPVEHLSQTALLLLQKMPAARHAVLEHFCNVFDEAAGAYIKQTDGDHKSEELGDRGQSQYSALQDVTGVLLNFINTNPEAWAPIVSSWSLNLLGQISSKYCDQQGMAMSASLNEALQLWMTCPPTKLLMELAIECFATMVGSAPDVCVDALLEASVKFSPHFDWVVARVGSCFPTTIITRVLNCGLKDFCNVGKGLSDRDPGARKKIPKMASVVGILGHLASKHRQDIRKALMALFEEGLQSDGDAVRVTTVPFLLQLASMSPMLLQVLTTDLVKALTPSVLNRLHHQFSGWKMSNPVDYNSFLNLVVHLLGKCDIGAFDILNFMIITAVPSLRGSVPEESVTEAVQDTCVELIHMLLFELQRSVYGKRREGTLWEMPLLEGLARETERLVQLLLTSAESSGLPWIEKLLIFTAVHSGESCAAKILAAVIMQASTPKQLSLYFHLQENMEKSLGNIARDTLNNVFGAISAVTELPQLVQMLRNFERVILGEKKRARLLTALSSFLLEAMQKELGKLSDILLHPNIEVSMCGLRLLETVGVPATTEMPVLTCLSASVVLVLFNLLWEGVRQRRAGIAKKPRFVGYQRGVGLCHSCLRNLSQHTFTQSLLLQYLLQGAIHEENAALFGGKPPEVSQTRQSEVSLLKENCRFGLSMPLPRTHASVFHAGVIGQGLKPNPPNVTMQKEWVLCHQETLLEAIWSCSQDAAASHLVKDSTSTPAKDARSPMRLSSMMMLPKMSDVAARTLGCALVDICTMDTLYNDVNWPDPEFCKVTLERDLYVWKMTEDHPVLWSILRAASGSSVFLYYCSPLMKSLMARVVSALEVSRVRKLMDLPQLFERASWIVTILSQGKFIPPPLSNICELFPHVSPYEGYLLLLSVWKFIKENPPTLNKEGVAQRCEIGHLQVLRTVLNSNIDMVGHLYPKIFDT